MSRDYSRTRSSHLDVEAALKLSAEAMNEVDTDDWLDGKLSGDGGKKLLAFGLRDRRCGRLDRDHFLIRQFHLC
jgi:hypothetical protein